MIADAVLFVVLKLLCDCDLVESLFAALDVELGARCDACHDRIGQAPIHWAAEGGHTSTVELLISKGADVNLQDE